MSIRDRHESGRFVNADYRQEIETINEFVRTD